ncbi:MAG: serine/threonine protein kinase [Pseudomonadales bacterium]
MNTDQEHPFDRLTPDFICDAIDSTGLSADARLFPLNSFENRVYQVGIHDTDPLIAKFYRPGRWSVDQILEEHRFSEELLDAELDVISPLNLDGPSSLFEYQGFHFALFKRMGGSPPDIEHEENLAILGRLLGRMHAVARSDKFQHRPEINTDSYARSTSALLADDWLPMDLQASYNAIAKDVLEWLQKFEDEIHTLSKLRSHGDFHLGNMIYRDQRIHMLDFDDTRSALAIQDIWMLLSGEADEIDHQLSTIINNYEQFHNFDWRETHFIEYYRTLRIMHHSGWIASRWNDPAFPLAFPWFDNASYWSNQILALREQLYALQQSYAGLAGNR